MKRIDMLALAPQDIKKGASCKAPEGGMKGARQPQNPAPCFLNGAAEWDPLAPRWMYVSAHAFPCALTYVSVIARSHRPTRESILRRSEGVKGIRRTL